MEVHPLLGAAVLQLTCVRSSAGQTAEVADGAGARLATSDGAGAITDAAGRPLLWAPVVLGNRGERGTDAKLVVSDAAGAPLGEADVVKYSIGPRSSKTTLAIRHASGQEVGRFEPQDRKGEQVEISAMGRPVGTLERVSHDRGILRSTSTYRLELTGHIDGWLRPLLLAAAIRYQALAAEVADASQRRERRMG